MTSEGERFWPSFAFRVFETAEEMAAAAVDTLLEVAEDRSCRVALPTGRTFVSFYENLAERCRENPHLDLGGATGFNLDELVLPKEHPKSFAAYMEEYVWSQTTLDRKNFKMPNARLVASASSSASSRASSRAEQDAVLAEVCLAYDRAMEEFLPLDLALLGVGVDGHVGYNLPGPPHEKTHAVELPEALAEELEVAQELRPLRAVTMGFAPLRTARRVLLLAGGARKADAVRRLIEGPPDPQWPCTLLRDHGGFELYVDKEALGSLDFDASRGFAGKVE